jgi:uncharacterized protein (DUF58 family)
MLTPNLSPSLLNQLELFRIRSRRAFLGTRQGAHRSLKKGHGLEFSDYRKYELGDNPRAIDWGVFGRTDKLYIKRFEEEQELRVAICLDNSASMFVPPEAKKWEYARDLALGLSYVGLMAQDLVTVLPMSGGRCPECFGPSAIHVLAADLLKVSSAEKVDFSRALQGAAARTKLPGVAVVISDFLTPIEEIRVGFAALLSRNLDITAIQIACDFDEDPPLSLNNSTVMDLENEQELSISFDEERLAAYKKYVAKHNDELSSYFSSQKIRRVRFRTSSDFASEILATLPFTGILG